MAGQTMADSGVLRRVLGRYLRGLRLQARLTTKAAAGLLELVESIVARVLNALIRAGSGMLFPLLVILVPG